MFTRMLSVSVVAGLASLGCLGLSPLSAAQAAYPSWYGYTTQPKRAQFRPWHRAERQQPATRWRPQSTDSRGLMRPQDRRRATTFTMSQTRAVGRPIGSDRHFAAPKAVLERPSVKFRPDARATPQDQWQGQDTASRNWRGAALGVRFRPTEKRPKLTYEQTRTADGGMPQARNAPYVAYGAAIRPVPPIFGAPWARW